MRVGLLLLVRGQRTPEGEGDRREAPRGRGCGVHTSEGGAGDEYVARLVRVRCGAQGTVPLV